MRRLQQRRVCGYCIPHFILKRGSLCVFVREKESVCVCVHVSACLSVHVHVRKRERESERGNVESVREQCTFLCHRNSYHLINLVPGVFRPAIFIHHPSNAREIKMHLFRTVGCIWCILIMGEKKFQNCSFQNHIIRIVDVKSYMLWVILLWDAVAHVDKVQ